MKNTIKHITLAVVIATVTLPAHATWTETVQGYWNSTCAKSKAAAQAVQAMPEAVSNWCTNTYFFATNLHKISAIMAKIDANTASKEECEVLADAIRASALPAHTKNVHVSTLKRYAQQQAVTQEEMLKIKNDLVSIKNAQKQNFINIGAYTAAVATGIAAIYAYKRLIARPAIAGWCA